LLRRFDVSEPSKESNPAQIELARERSHLDGHVRSGEAADQQLADAASKRLRRHDLSL
jgi:hypothetical protein